MQLEVRRSAPKRRTGHTTAVTIGAERLYLIRPGLGLLFPPSGRTDDPQIPRVRSAADYIARRLAIDWLPYPERAALGVYTLTERVAHARAWIESCEPDQIRRDRL